MIPEADSSSDSSFPELARIHTSEDAPVEPLALDREYFLLAMLAQSQPVQISPTELQFFERAQFIKRMPAEVEKAFAELGEMISELFTLDGISGRNRNLVRPLVNFFRPTLRVVLPTAVKKHGLLGLATAKKTRRNQPLHPLIDNAQVHREKYQARVVELCLDLQKASGILLRYRNNHFAYVDIGAGRARITDEGRRRLWLLQVDREVFGD